jgi:hypothetical protein
MTNWLLLAIFVGGGLLGAAAAAQPVEIAPSDVPDAPNLGTEYRVDYGPTAEWAAEIARQRSEFRRTHWVEEAGRIARVRQNVVRDDDTLYVYLGEAGRSRAIAFRNIWGLDPGVNYLYRTFDEIGRFHIVNEAAVDNEGHTLLISATTGLMYRIYGEPIWSPDKARFFANAFNGMGCIEGVAVYRYDADKLFKEAESAMSCDQPCQHQWSGPEEIRSDCRSATGTGRVDYRLIHRNGTWRITRSPEAR